MVLCLLLSGYNQCLNEFIDDTSMKFSGRIPRQNWYLYSVWQGNRFISVILQLVLSSVAVYSNVDFPALLVYEQIGGNIYISL